MLNYILQNKISIRTIIIMCSFQNVCITNNYLIHKLYISLNFNFFQDKVLLNRNIQVLWRISLSHIIYIIFSV